jgi:hypothetical protein
MGLTATQWITVTPTQYDAIPKGNDYFPEGMFLENDLSQERDKYSGGQLHWVSPVQQVLAGLKTSQFVMIGADRFNLIPHGSDFVAPPVTQTSSGGGSNS